MYTFILTILIVSFISACFFKKKFWENRYIVLAIIAGVALIATLSINFVTRNDNPNEVRSVWVKECQPMNIEASLVDSNFVATKDSLILDDFEAEKDTIQNYYIFYNNGDGYRIGFNYNDHGYYKKSISLENIVIYETDSDKPYYSKERVYYGNRNNKWVTNISLPFIKSYKCYYMPHDDYVKLISSGLIKNEKS